MPPGQLEVSYHPAMPDIQTLYERILAQLSSYLELASDSELLQLRHNKTSDWDVAQHLVHLALVDTSILNVLERDPAESKPLRGGPNPLGRCMLALGFIPRGKGRAPAIANPREPELSDVAPQIERTQQRFVDLEPALPRLEQSGPLAPHFAFGKLNGKQWLRFVDIHHHHHDKIVRDIRNATGHG